MAIPLERMGEGDPEHVDTRRISPIFYARFTVPEGAVVMVEVTLNQPGQVEVTTEPQRLFINPKLEDGRLRFGVKGAGPRVVRFRRGEVVLAPLFVFVQLPEDDPPRPGDTGVFNVEDWGITPSEEPQTEKIQQVLDACSASPQGARLRLGLPGQ